MFPSEFKSEEKLHITINILMVILVITSITLTIVESIESIMTPELRDIFLSIHIAILAAFLAEFFYRLWDASQKYEGDSPIRATLKFLIQPLTIIDIIVISPLFAILWTHDLSNADAVILRVLRFTSILNMFHFYQSSRIVKLIKNTGKEIWFEMMVVLIMIAQCVLIMGLIFYAVEYGNNPQVNTIVDGISWSLGSLIKVGYIDVTPVTFWGKILDIFLTLLSVALIALPTGLLTSSFLRLLKTEKKISKIMSHMQEEEQEQDDIIERIEEIETVMKKTKKPSLTSSKIFKKKKRSTLG